MFRNIALRNTLKNSLPQLAFTFNLFRPRRKIFFRYFNFFAMQKIYSDRDIYISDTSFFVNSLLELPPFYLFKTFSFVSGISKIFFKIFEHYISNYVLYIAYFA